MQEVPWTKQDASAFRTYLKNSSGRLVLQLEQCRPASLTRSELLTLPAEAIARQQLLIEGYSMALAVLNDLRVDPASSDDGSN